MSAMNPPARVYIFPGFGRVGMEVRFHVPAVVGYLADGVLPCAEQRPEFLQVCSTREPACQTDQGDGKGSLHVVNLRRHAM